jgi:hypothetical protein
MSIRNRNTVWNTAGNSSRDSDKFVQLPVIANASLPAAASSNEGGIVYDATNNKLLVSNGGSWGSPVTGASNALDDLDNVAINTSLVSDTDSTDNLGSSSKYWANAYVDKVYLNATATIDGSSAGVLSVVGDITIGENDTGYDLTCFGATSGKYMIWDESADQLQLTDSTEIVLGGTPGSEDGLSMQFDGTSSILFDAITENDVIDIGSVTNTDLTLHGGSADADIEWDASENSLTVTAGAKLVVVGDASGDGTEGLEIPWHDTESPNGEPGKGAIFFEVDADKLWVFNGTAWVGTVLT